MNGIPVFGRVFVPSGTYADQEFATFGQPVLPAESLVGNDTPELGEIDPVVDTAYGPFPEKRLFGFLFQPLRNGYNLQTSE